MEVIFSTAINYVTPYGLRFISAFTCGPEQAIDNLQREGSSLIEIYAKGQSPNADRVAQAISYGLVPVKALLVGGGMTTGGLYLLSKVIIFLPILPSFFKISWIVTAWLTVEIAIVYFHMRSMYVFFSNCPEDQQIDQKEFIRHVNNFSRDILAKTPFLSTMIESIRDFKNMGTVVSQLIENEKKGENKESPDQIVQRYIPHLMGALSLGQFLRTALQSSSLDQE